MEIVVCVKPVPEAESRLRPTANGAQLETEGVKFVLAGYDESAVEQALLLREAVPGSRVTAIAAGPAPRTEEVLRAALALGCDAAIWVELSGATADDPIAVARALAPAIAALPYGLVLTGKHAGDTEEGLVGAALGELLGVPDVGHVTDLRSDPAGGRLTFHRSVETGVERWEATLPCVIALQQAWNDPRTAKLPAILKSRKIPIAKVVPVPSGPAGTTERFELPPPRSGAKIIEHSTPEEAAQRLVRALREEAKVFP